MDGRAKPEAQFPGTQAHTQAMRQQHPSAGLTVVEIAIAAAVITVICAVAVYVLQTRHNAQHRADEAAEQAQLQELANTEPYKVFEFRPIPMRDRYNPAESIYLFWVVSNTTKHELNLPLHGVMNVRFGERSDLWSINWMPVSIDRDGPVFLGSQIVDGRAIHPRKPKDVPVSAKTSLLLCQLITLPPNYLNNARQPRGNMEIQLIFTAEISDIAEVLDYPAQYPMLDRGFPAVTLQIFSP